jgi:agmatine deiminase
MGFPTDNYVGSSPDLAVSAWSAVANAIVDFEPVTMLVNPSDRPVAERALDSRITLQDCPMDDSWLRDSGPTFVFDGKGDLGAVTWRFNGWGAQEWASWDLDAAVGAQVAGWSGATEWMSPFVNEGGGIAVDGSGTVILTRSVQLDAGRNPTASEADIEREFAAKLGTTRFVWVERGLTGDYQEFGTRGHIDLVAAFTGPGTVVAHLQPDPNHPDHVLTKAIHELLAEAGLDVTPVDAPAGVEHDGRLIDWSYINFYVGNGFVLLPVFGDSRRDEAAAATLAGIFPGREVRTVDGRPLFSAGGGVHCITQQQPAPAAFEWRTV